MKYLVIVFSFCLMFLATSCTNGCNSGIGCSIEKTVVSGLSPAIANGLQCSNPAAIEADLKSVVDKLNLCKENDPSKLNKLPGPICSMIADLVLSGVAQIAIPSTWGCTASNAKGLLKTVIVTACTSL